MVVVFVPIDNRFLAIQKSDPHGIRLFLAAEQARHLKHHSRGRRAILRAHKIRHAAQRIVMREQQNNSLPRSGCFRDDVLHRYGSGRRGRVKIVFIHGAPKALQLPANVILHVMNALRPRRARPEAHDLGHLIVRFRAIEPSRLRGRRR